MISNARREAQLLATSATLDITGRLDAGQAIDEGGSTTPNERSIVSLRHVPGNVQQEIVRRPDGSIMRFASTSSSAPTIPARSVPEGERSVVTLRHVPGNVQQEVVRRADGSIMRFAGSSSSSASPSPSASRRSSAAGSSALAATAGALSQSVPSSASGSTGGGATSVPIIPESMLAPRNPLLRTVSHLAKDAPPSSPPISPPNGPVAGSGSGYSTPNLSNSRRGSAASTRSARNTSGAGTESTNAFAAAIAASSKLRMSRAKSQTDPEALGISGKAKAKTPSTEPPPPKYVSDRQTSSGAISFTSPFNGQQLAGQSSSPSTSPTNGDSSQQVPNYPTKGKSVDRSREAATTSPSSSPILVASAYSTSPSLNPSSAARMARKPSAEFGGPGTGMSAGRVSFDLGASGFRRGSGDASVSSESADAPVAPDSARRPSFMMSNSYLRGIREEEQQQQQQPAAAASAAAAASKSTLRDKMKKWGRSSDGLGLHQPAASMEPVPPVPRRSMDAVSTNAQRRSMDAGPSSQRRSSLFNMLAGASQSSHNLLSGSGAEGRARETPRMSPTSSQQSNPAENSKSAKSRGFSGFVKNAFGGSRSAEPLPAPSAPIAVPVPNARAETPVAWVDRDPSREYSTLSQSSSSFAMSSETVLTEDSPTMERHSPALLSPASPKPAGTDPAPRVPAARRLSADATPRSDVPPPVPQSPLNAAFASPPGILQAANASSGSSGSGNTNSNGNTSRSSAYRHLPRLSSMQAVSTGGGASGANGNGDDEDSDHEQSGGHVGDEDSGDLTSDDDEEEEESDHEHSADASASTDRPALPPLSMPGAFFQPPPGGRDGWVNFSQPSPSPWENATPRGAGGMTPMGTRGEQSYFTHTPAPQSDLAKASTANGGPPPSPSVISRSRSYASRQNSGTMTPSGRVSTRDLPAMPAPTLDGIIRPRSGSGASSSPAASNQALMSPRVVAEPKLMATPSISEEDEEEIRDGANTSASRPPFDTRRSSSMTLQEQRDLLLARTDQRRSRADTSLAERRAASRPTLYSQQSRSLIDLNPAASRRMDASPDTEAPPTLHLDDLPKPEAAVAMAAAKVKTPGAGGLSRRRSMFEIRQPPPPYSILHWRPEGPQIIYPREEEGQEKLPNYSAHVHIEGYLPRKMEFSAPGVQAKDRSWRRLYFVLHGTMLKVYSKDLSHAATTNSWGNMSGVHVHPDPINEDDSSTSGLASARDAVTHLHIGGNANKGILVRSYTLQGAESGLAADYLKRRHVVRVRAEGEQFLLQTRNDRHVVDWIEALQAGTNISMDLETRPSESDLNGRVFTQIADLDSPFSAEIHHAAAAPQTQKTQRGRHRYLSRHGARGGRDCGSATPVDRGRRWRSSKRSCHATACQRSSRLRAEQQPQLARRQRRRDQCCFRGDASRSEFARLSHAPLLLARRADCFRAHRTRRTT